MRGIQEDATPCTTNEIQDIFFAMLECLKKVFDLQIPTKYKLNFFTNDLISNYKARCDPCMTFQVKSAEDSSESQHSQDVAAELPFSELWKMCQDSGDIIKILDLIESVRQELWTQRNGINPDASAPAQPPMFENKQNALWKYRVMDMVDDTTSTSTCHLWIWA